MLSVIIPSYKSQDTIKKCLESVINQTRSTDEIIFIDDCSPDKSVEIVNNNFPKVKVLQNSSNKGACYSRNRGIKKSKGDKILCIDSDVYLNERTIEKLLSKIDKFDIVYPKVFFEDGKVLVPRGERGKKYLDTSTVFMIRKESLDKLDELFDENYFIYYDDVDFFIRCYLNGLTSKYVDNAQATHVLKHSLNTELRYFFEVKNTIYGLLKYRGKLPKEVKDLFLFPKVYGLLSLFSQIFRNKNTFPDAGITKKIAESRIKVLYLFLAALKWNLENLGKILKYKRQKM